ncbi:4Fe-4S binding protein [bacterium]|nr:4Fe-4S binding protein [bacterium]
MTAEIDIIEPQEKEMDEEKPSLALVNVARKVYAYFANIWEALYTLAVGLSVTVPTFFKKPYTVLYPEVDLLKPWDENNPEPLSHQVSERYRGFLFNQIEQCTSCGSCRTICPVDAIEVEGQKYPEVKGLVLKHFTIDYALCIYCGLCVETCPAGCLTFQRAFENPVDDLAKLYRVFVTEEDHKALLEKAPRKAAKPEPPASDKKEEKETETTKGTGAAKKADKPASTTKPEKTAANSLKELEKLMKTETKKGDGPQSGPEKTEKPQSEEQS